ncbi:hypothetical protein J3458_000691 [Metarhizium acridum]|uniref:uncharacterized protein n=1 Tax=Metarhizium acridum TaxID=92637 RepID=UPI001C6B59F9|nr:hypothetical protein J3458_000691 [Metarhizium acridum]
MPAFSCHDDYKSTSRLAAQKMRKPAQTGRYWQYDQPIEWANHSLHFPISQQLEKIGEVANMWRVHGGNMPAHPVKGTQSPSALRKNPRVPERMRRPRPSAAGVHQRGKDKSSFPTRTPLPAAPTPSTCVSLAAS